LGLPIIMPACFGPGDLDMANTKEIDHLVGVLKSAAPKAEKEGMILGLESYLSAEDNLKILDRVGSPALKVYYDVGNSTDKGRDVLKEIPLLGKLICEFHFKDANYRLGQGRIDFRKVRQALDKIDYSGWIHIEAATPGGVLQDYAADYKYLRGIFPEHAAE
jgi:L-ribulose-5-phosphate 3-epimerase